jgi:hypothetical protein
MGRVGGVVRVRWLTMATVVLLGMSILGGSALASGVPAWRMTVEGFPSDVPEGGSGTFLVQVENIGDGASASGSPITVVDRLPAGIVATQASGSFWGCAISPDRHTVTCTYQAGVTIPPVSRTPGGSDLVGHGSNSLAEAISINVSVEPSAVGSQLGTATVSGGGASVQASGAASIDVSSFPAPFGIASFDQWSTNVDGTPATQAGSHPYETTTSFTIDTDQLRQGGIDGDGPAGVTRNVSVELPAGFVGNPSVVPKCPRQAFDVFRQISGSIGGPKCPSDTQVGVALVTLDVGGTQAQVPVYNLVPPSGVPAQFGIGLFKFVGFLDAGVRPVPGGVYNLVVDSHDIQTEGAVSVRVSLWGVPADPAHNVLRLLPGENEPHGRNVSSDVVPGPFLRLPTSCGVPQTLAMSAVSWADPLTVVSPPSAFSSDEQGNPITIGGCSKLDFSPSVEAKPGTAVAESPVGLSVGVAAPQDENPNELSEADLKDVHVTLPAGMTVSPSAANGLQACSEEQIGVSGSGSGLLFNESQPGCPGASKVGSVEVITPLLEHPLTGALYLAQQEKNPFGSLIALYLVAEGSGVLVKRVGEVRLDPQTGQITAAFLDNPQVPLSEIKVNTFQSSRSSLMTPAGCGGYTMTTSFTGWNGSFASPSSKPFPVRENCGQGFSPSFTAGSTNNQAGAFSPFSVAFSRKDGEQRIADASVLTPPGLSAVLKGVQRCPEPQASNATCGPESQVGHATVAVGPGPEPFYAPANVFLTGPYGGAPFGLSIVAQAQAGPFNLGTVVVRARINIDSRTAQVVVTPDSSGPYAIPTILKGVPLDLRLASVTIDRPGFIFNPTSCSPLNVYGVMSSATTEASVPVSSPSRATGCAKLPFKPAFTVSTQAQTSKADGASLTVKITKKAGEANLHKADLQLPIALPARLTTLQKACTEAQFDANPAGCPVASVIGTAKLITPQLSVPVTGPAFLVSHGGAAFPDVEFVLQGEGITVIVDGATNIKKGITYSKFETAPDAPFSSFETRLPEGPYSVLATNIPAKAKGSLCGQALTMPTTLTGQNGATLTQTTKIATAGCPKSKIKQKNKQGQGRKTAHRKTVKTTGGAK